MTSLSDISVIIPTLQAEAHLPRLLAALRAQRVAPREILVLDSESTDRTCAIARAAGCELHLIARRDFNHGGTRNQGALWARGSILVYLTQDATPAAPDFLGALATPIAQGRAAASYARQLARAEAGVLERFQREFQYPPVHAQDHLRLGCFFSNSAAAVQRSTFFAVGGFPPHVAFSEDMVLSLKLQRAGHRVLYVPEALVIHSHGLGLEAQFRRYFDAGSALAQLRAKLPWAEVAVAGEGVRYVAALFRHLRRTRQWRSMPAAVAEVATKAIGFQCGQRARWIPAAVRQRIGLHREYWRRSEAWQADDARILASTAAAAAQAGRG